MRNSIKSRLLTALVVATFSAPVWAVGGEDNQGDFAMAGDLLIARPFGVVWTVAGSALFVAVHRARRKRQASGEYAGDRSGEGDVRALPRLLDRGPLRRPERCIALT